MADESRNLLKDHHPQPATPPTVSDRHVSTRAQSLTPINNDGVLAASLRSGYG
jgi:hypothetical protein